jgi:hypothetical protein
MNGQASYHGTAQLTVVVVNRKEYVHPPSGIGVSTLHLCSYWLHTPNDSGTIAIDAPRQIVPTLGQFFDIWGQPLSLQNVWRYSAGGGVTLAYVGATPHTGDLRGIKLYNGTSVTDRGRSTIHSPAGQALFVRTVSSRVVSRESLVLSH